MTQESDGINEIFEHTLHVGTGVLTEHARAAIAAAPGVRAQTTQTEQSTQRTLATVQAIVSTLSPQEAQAADIGRISNARPVDDALHAPSQAPTARRAVLDAGRQIERDLGR